MVGRGMTLNQYGWTVTRCQTPEQLGRRAAPRPSTRTGRQLQPAPTQGRDAPAPRLRGSGDTPHPPTSIRCADGHEWGGGGVPCLPAPVSKADGQGKVGPPPSAVSQLTDKCKRARPLASSRQMGASVLDWRVDGVPLAWQTEGPTLTRVKGRAGVCVCACVRETFSNVEAWPPMHISGHPLSHNVCLITTGAKATFVQAVLL